MIELIKAGQLGPIPYATKLSIRSLSLASNLVQIKIEQFGLDPWHGMMCYPRRPRT
jgi:hypothetical protein